MDNLELILGKLASNPDAVGVLSYSYLEQFANRIHAASVNGVAPSRATVPAGIYPLSRPLFIRAGLRGGGKVRLGYDGARLLANGPPSASSSMTSTEGIC